ncbi:hypothetical protein O181_083851 [Austropuccinia psidii MF-1]|uniref:Uncharacterized protein n=1 Tax=Austropuccinia psidii MF-1 TaxID=1389203 RepID=A0A9Q3II94_9BASI|nr:hypothetical protein [Austropuccinia psidii MF-1]
MCILTKWRLCVWATPNRAGPSTDARNQAEKVRPLTPREGQQSTTASQLEDLIYDPILLDDGSHPYFPGTPWNQLELTGLIDAKHQPRRKRVRFKRRPKTDVQRLFFLEPVS